MFFIFPPPPPSGTNEQRLSLSLVFTTQGGAIRAQSPSLCTMSAAAALSSRQGACSASGRSAARPSTSAPSILFPSSTSSSSSSSSHRRLLRGSLSRASCPVVALAAMQPGELYIPDPLMDVSAIRAAAGAPGAAAGAGGGGGGRPRRRGPPDLPSLLMDGRIVYLGMPVRFRSFLRAVICRGTRKSKGGGRRDEIAKKRNENLG